MLRHRDVEHADVRALAQRELDRLDAVGGLGDDLHVGLAVEQQLQPAADDPVVVGDQQPHAATRMPRAGSVSSIVVPSPGAERTSIVPAREHRPLAHPGDAGAPVVELARREAVAVVGDGDLDLARRCSPRP